MFRNRDEIDIFEDFTPDLSCIDSDHEEGLCLFNKFVDCEGVGGFYEGVKRNDVGVNEICDFTDFDDVTVKVRERLGEKHADKSEGMFEGVKEEEGSHPISSLQDIVLDTFGDIDTIVPDSCMQMGEEAEARAAVGRFMKEDVERRTKQWIDNKTHLNTDVGF